VNFRVELVDPPFGRFVGAMVMVLFDAALYGEGVASLLSIKAWLTLPLYDR